MASIFRNFPEKFALLEQELADTKAELNSLKEEIDKLALTQKRIMIVLNDPCHNPTGYSMSNDEWIEVIDFLNKFLAVSEQICAIFS